MSTTETYLRMNTFLRSMFTHKISNVPFRMKQNQLSTCGFPGANIIGERR